MAEVSGGHALLVKPHDVDDIAYNLARILKEEDTRWRLSAQGEEWAKKFSWENTARETVKVFEKVYNQ
jgi:glycosyltransferase involved in cell wall biosynthesis